MSEPNNRLPWGRIIRQVAQNVLLYSCAAFGVISAAQRLKQPIEFTQRSGYSQVLCEERIGEFAERIVKYGREEGLEYSGRDGTYTAVFSSPEVLQETRHFLREHYSANKCGSVLESIDADRNGEITKKELDDYIGD